LLRIKYVWVTPWFSIWWAWIKIRRHGVP